MILGRLLPIVLLVLAYGGPFLPRLVVPPTPLTDKAVYMIVVPFPTVIDDLSGAALQDYWHGHPNALPDFQTLSGNAPTLIASDATITILRAQLGEPAPGVVINTVAADQVANALWRLRPLAIGIVPFSQVTPSEKVLAIDGINPLLPEADLSRYPLALAITDAVPEAVRNLSKLTVLVMSGTTAITRAMAYVMERNGITKPALDVQPFLADADFVHTSNELAFTADCPYPNPVYRADALIFCSRESYFALLQAIHLNIVELTGNHVNDWGTDAFSHTLDLYDQAHIGTFGGGRTAESARQPLIITHNGSTIALIGCNQAGPTTAWATDKLPGAAQCDDDYLSTEIPKLKAANDLVVMTLQYLEFDYYIAPPIQIEFFQKYADLGADVVFGSQAHHPQGFAFGKGTSGTLIDYGTGNMFFDQMDSYELRQMRMDKLIIYDGHLLSTLLFTGLRQDYSHTPPMSAPERSQFLNTVFKASGW